MIREKSTSTPYLPTEDEIRAACRQIRSGWSPRERESRCVRNRVVRRLFSIRRPVFRLKRMFGVA
jgi:hypothetical protein